MVRELEVCARCDEVENERKTGRQRERENERKREKGKKRTRKKERQTTYSIKSDMKAIRSGTL